MKKALLLLLVTVLLVGVIFVAASCDNSTTSSDGPTELTPDDNAYWYQEENVFCPTDIDRTGTDKNVNELYKDIKESKPQNIVLTSGEQALVLAKDGDVYDIKIYIVSGKDYIPLFTTEVKELVDGLGKPNAYETKTIDGNKAVVMTGGDGGHSFTLTCTALKDEGLLHFELDAQMGKAFSLSRQDFGFAMKGCAEVTYGQMPTSIYGNMLGYDNVGIAMPAAYLWDKGREAVVLFDYTDTAWMASGIYLPGRQGYVDGKYRTGYTSLGLCYSNDKNNRPVGAGTVTKGQTLNLDFYIFAGLSAKRQGISCIARKAEVMSSIHPTKVVYPEVRNDLKDQVTLSWEEFSEGTVSGLMNNLAFNKVSMNLKDPIAVSDNRGEILYLSYARQTADRYTATDYSCNNNWLAAMASYNRIKDNKDVATMVTSKMDALQFYYDPDSDMYRYGFRYENQLGKYSMPWQNGFYHTDVYRSTMHSSPEDYSPSALANLLSTVKGGWTELVVNLDYVLPQWTDPVNKKAETQQDVPDLAIVYEPWQIGSYAYTCLKSYEVTGDKSYIDLASTALNKVINEVTFNVQNKVYTKTYQDSAEFPITELFGTANGTYACYRLFELTGEEKWLTYSEAFFGMLSQLTFWYDDNMSNNAETSTWVGLFEPHGGASNPCPWESIEAVLPLTEILNATGDYLFNDLILAILNTQRVSAYNFYPVTWSTSFRNQMAYGQEDFYFIPTEPMYNTIGNGNSDYGALYMSSISFWNYLMYEAFATVDNRDVMILNTDVQANFENAVRGATRNFVLYNPKSERVTVKMAHHELPDGNYIVTVEGGKSKTYTAAELKPGLPYTVASRPDIRIKVVAEDESLLVAAGQDTMTRYHLATAFNLVIEKVQDIAREKLATLYPIATEKELNNLVQYVLTYMTYEDTMAHALNSNSVDSLKQQMVNRQITTIELKKLYNENANVQLPTEYITILDQLDAATVLYREGKCKEAYLLCDGIIKAVQDCTEAEFVASLSADSETE